MSGKMLVRFALNAEITLNLRLLTFESVSWASGPLIVSVMAGRPCGVLQQIPAVFAAAISCVTRAYSIRKRRDVHRKWRRLWIVD